MPDVPANPNVEPKRYSAFWFRLLEILPGTCVWLAIIAPFVLSLTYPLAVTLFIIIFDVYWLQKSLITAVTLFKGYRRLRHSLNTDWQALCDNLANATEAERAEINAIDPSTLYNAVILTTYKEEIAILRSSIDSLVHTQYPKEKLILVLATEARDSANARAMAAELQKDYQDSFFRFIVTEHPDKIIGEVKGKGANATWAAKQLKAEMENCGIPLDRVIVSTADADSRFVANYFLCLSYIFAITPDRNNCSYQPVATFLNNVWEAPMISRVMAFGTTFWQLVESVRDYRLLTFSTHAMSLRTLVDIDYWCTSIVNEDSRQFFRAFFHYEGKFRSVPLFMPVYMDAVHVSNVMGTLKNLYLQQQRWAYGVEHFPYIVLESFHHKEIPWLNRTMLIWRAFNGSFSWATNAFFISVVGWLPIGLNHAFRDQVLASNFPLVTSMLLTITWVGIIASTYISLRLLPPVPDNRRHQHMISMIIQWIFVPVCTVFFGALPGIDSQTRLMFGKYLGFRVTEKKAVKPIPAPVH